MKIEDGNKRYKKCNDKFQNERTGYAIDKKMMYLLWKPERNNESKLYWNLININKKKENTLSRENALKKVPGFLEKFWRANIINYK